jgi:hypothetical protein
MRRESLYVALLLLAVLVTLIYSTMIFLQSQVNVYLGIALIWAILLPVLYVFPYNFSYFLCLPSPILGAWLLITVQIEQIVGFSLYLPLISMATSFSLVLVFHFLTRKRAMLWNLPMATLSRIGMASISVIFLLLGFMIINPSAMVLDMKTRLFYFMLVLLAYICSSMLYVNYSYRQFVISNRLNVLRFEEKLSKIWMNINKKFPDKQNDVNLLQYYFYESLRGFLEGNYEKSFIWGYKVIREKTLVDPCKYINDKRTNKPSFSDIRNTLEHSRRKGHVDTLKIRRILKNIFDDCVDLLEREFNFIKKLAEEN